MKVTKSTSWFTRFAKWTSHVSGSPPAFALAISIVVVWAVTGPLFGYSDTWQLVINTGTTIVTFLMVFLIQNTQNRDSQATQVKLDELIRCTSGAHNALLNLEELEEHELVEICSEYKQIAQRPRVAIRKGKERHRNTARAHPAEALKAFTRQDWECVLHIHAGGMSLQLLEWRFYG